MLKRDWDIEPIEETNNKIMVKVRDLNLYYGDFQALKNVSMDVEEKKVTALIGPSGCGKSTFIKCINRMNDLISGCRVKGDIIVDGTDIYKDNIDVAYLRKEVGMVFQKPNPFEISIFDNIAYGPRAHGMRDKKRLKEIVERSLKQAALWEEVKDRMNQSAMGLSGGQQQRLCIARTLAVEPEVVLMDEPTSALDPVSTLKIEDLIEQLKRQYTIIIVTHNMQQAGRVSDRTAFFLHGAIVEFDATATIFQNPTDKRTEDYITGRFG